jgi:lipid-A-disaccharide synthase-like uncharacterized protein
METARKFLENDLVKITNSWFLLKLLFFIIFTKSFFILFIFTNI